MRDLAPHLSASLRVEAGGRLIEEKHLRLVHQTHGDIELVLSAAGVGFGNLVGYVLEAKTLDQTVDTAA